MKDQVIVTKSKPTGRLIWSVVLFSCSTLLSAEILSLDSYLEQVQRNNSEYKSSLRKISAASHRADEAKIKYQPKIFSDLAFGLDRSPRQNPALTGEKSRSLTAIIGASDKTTFGLNTSLSYSTLNSRDEDFDPSLRKNDQSNENSLNFELSQSLWKDGFGKLGKLEENLAEASLTVSSLGESAKNLSLLREAETRYWSLAIRNRILNVYKDSLDRASKILKYSVDRQRKNLSEKSDVLQAEASLELRRLELESATQDKSQAALLFNSSRGLSSDELDSELDSPTPESIVALKLPAPAKIKLETKLSLASAKAAKIQAEIGARQSEPELSFYGQALLSGADEKFSKSSSDAFSGKKPKFVVGLRFSTYLDSAIIDKTNKGYNLTAEAAEFDAQTAMHNQDVLWQDLSKKFESAKRRLKLSQTLETAQMKKLENEKSLQKTGRSTTYQILIFEQEYLNAQLGTLRIVNETMGLYAQLKTFGEQV